MFVPITKENLLNVLGQHKAPIRVNSLHNYFLIVRKGHYERVKKIIFSLEKEGLVRTSQGVSSASELFGTQLAKALNIEPDEYVELVR